MVNDQSLPPRVNIPRPIVWFLLLTLAGCHTSRHAAMNTPEVSDDDIGTAVYVGEHEIRPYRPVPALRVARHDIRTPRFTAIDIHCHWSLDVDPERIVRAMDDLGLAAAVNLSGGWGDELDEHLARAEATAPDRLLVFCNVDFSRCGEPNFAAEVTAFLEDARRRGCAGLKVFKSLGLTVKDDRDELVAVDDPRLDPVWATCGRLGMPVLIHTGDPIAFFQPIDENNERWMQLRRHPDWSFYGDEFPAREEVLAQRDRVMSRHRGTTFIGAHIGNSAEDLDAAARRLDAHPNLVVDISGRVGELGRQPYSARRFFLKYPDRILFGTDRYPGRPDQPRERLYYRFLETEDQYFNYYDHPFPPSGDWKIYGIALPDDVLEQVYYRNAARVLGPIPLAVP